MPDKLIIQVGPVPENHIATSAHVKISLQHDDEEPRKLDRVQSLTLNLDAEVEPRATLHMYLHDTDATVAITPEHAAAILKVEHGRSLHFLDEDDRAALDELFHPSSSCSASQRRTIGKILIELDLRAQARSELPE